MNLGAAAREGGNSSSETATYEATLAFLVSRAPLARHPPLFVRVRRMLETVASVYFTCFKCARTMLQVFYMDVAILHVFHTNVVSVLFRCCIFH